MCVQLCQAHRNEAQKHVIVVMSRRPKLKMEEIMIWSCLARTLCVKLL